MAIRLGINGACGRMGRAVGRLALQDRAFRIAAAVAAPGDARLGADYGRLLGADEIGVVLRSELRESVDAVIDFSTPGATRARLAECVRRRVPIVIGTTGLTDADRRAARAAARKIPVLIASNMSVGVNLLLAFLPRLAAALGPGYDIDIVETHHRFKKDAPSGTALALARAIREGAGPDRKIGVHSVRAGDAVGEHRVLFSSLGDTIELSHRANSRDIFARGALQAARVLARAKPRAYSMRDVLRFSLDRAEPG